MSRILILLLAACLLVSCDRGIPTSASAPDPLPVNLDPVQGIAWFAGSVDQAFSHAATEGKPVYLYWGAAWCPPCHAINATVFSSPEFQERSKLFVPVYLDGDTENAQFWGEKFGVLGYPTMIVFDPDGIELTRIPGGLDLQAYANVLDLVLSEAAPVGVLVESVLTSDVQLAPRQCAQLAYYSWGQDTRLLTDQSRADVFSRMYAACPEELMIERSMLYLTWLNEAITEARDGTESFAIAADERARAILILAEVLDSPELVNANLLPIVISGPKLVAALTDTGSDERGRFVAALSAVYDRVADDESIYKRERIYTLLGRIGLERIDDAEVELSGALRERVVDTVRWADETTKGVYDRQPVINALANVLTAAGMDEVAKPLLIAELDKSKQPYYFMVGLADIEQRAGNDTAAIEWLRRAHQESQGAATRFQWGVYYVNGLLDMTPEDAEYIHDVTIDLLTELLQSAGIYHRPKRQLANLEKNLLEWGELHDQGQGLSRIRESVLAACARLVSDEQEKAACYAFLERA